LGAKPAPPHTHTKLSYRQLLGELRIGVLIHPSGFDRLTPLNVMILTSHTLALAKVRRAAMVLTPHRVEALLTEPCESPV
jgi:hypothetical protein